MKNLKLLFAVALLTAIASTDVQAQTHKWRVNNTPDNKYIRKPDGTGICDHCFNSLATAVASPAVSANDTLYVEATPYSYGNAITPTKPVTIIGVGYYLLPTQNPDLQQSTEKSIVQSFVINPEASGTVLEGLYVSAGGSGIHNIIVDASDITIKRCAFEAITFSNNVTRSNVTITQNVGGGINQDNTANVGISNLIITNNYLTSATLYPGHVGNFNNNIIRNYVNGYSGMNYRDNIFADGDFTANDNNTNNTRNNTFGLTNWLMTLPDNTNEVEAPTSVFTTYPITFDGHFTTKPDCATCAHGYPWPSPGGTLKGLFGGTTPYVKAGIPNVPSIYKLTTTAQVATGSQTPVTISTRSNNNN